MRRIIPPLWVALAILAMAILHGQLPMRSLVPPSLRLGGYALIAVGLFLALWSITLFAKAKTPVKPFLKSTALVTGGPFRFSRNPIYLGMVVLLLGVAILFGTLTPFPVVVVFAIVIDRGFIVHEERLLRETFPGNYDDYCERVRRWLGRRSE